MPRKTNSPQQVIVVGEQYNRTISTTFHVAPGKPLTLLQAIRFSGICQPRVGGSRVELDAMNKIIVI